MIFNNNQALPQLHFQVKIPDVQPAAAAWLYNTIFMITLSTQIPRMRTSKLKKILNLVACAHLRWGCGLG
jgi:hypothetical protein